MSAETFFPLFLQSVEYSFLYDCDIYSYINFTLELLLFFCVSSCSTVSLLWHGPVCGFTYLCLFIFYVPMSVLLYSLLLLLLSLLLGVFLGWGSTLYYVVQHILLSVAFLQASCKVTWDFSLSSVLVFWLYFSVLNTIFQILFCQNLILDIHLCFLTFWRCGDIIINEKRRTKYRSKRTWFETIKKDMIIINLIEEMTYNRNKWKTRIHVADPNNLE